MNLAVIKGTCQLTLKRLVNRLGFDIVRTTKFRGAIPLKQIHLQHCHVVENRIKLLRHLPKHAVCAEIGIEKGDFSQKILSLTHPRRFHLIDINPKYIDSAKHRFAESSTEIVFHVGNSSDVLMDFPDNYFDWIYIDADHAYKSVSRDLEAARQKVQSSGLIVLNDYIFYDHLVKSKYGVVEAVNEFCNKYNFEIVYFALQDQLYNDVVLKKIARLKSGNL